MAAKWLATLDEMLEDAKSAQRRNHERIRDEKIAEALRAGLQTLVLPLPEGGEEVIDLRLH